MNFGYVVWNSIAHALTVGICEIMFVEGEKGIAWRQYKWRVSISSPSLWHLGTLSDQSEEKLEESQGTARDAAVVVGRHVSSLRGKGWVIHNWELVRTCVVILKDINWNEFWGVFCNFHFILIIITVNYICLIDLFLWNWYAIVLSVNPINRVLFLINMNWWNKVRRNLERDIDFVFSLFLAV